MILDKQNLFSDDQAITDSSVASTNYINLGDREIAKGTPVPIVIQATTGFANLSTLNIMIQTDDEATFTNPTKLAETGAIPVADLVAGYRANLNFFPKGNRGLTRLYYGKTGATETTGKITAGIVDAVQDGHHN